MLLLINWPATDMAALHSLLYFVAEWCANVNLPTAAVIFVQPLYVKDYEIVSTKNMKIFARLGEYHQLMSFLGSIGCLMEGSGPQTALECVYVQLTVGHMFSRKAYSRTVREHMLCASAVLSLLLEYFLTFLTKSQNAKLIEIYEWNNPDDYINDEVAIKLIDWFKNEERIVIAGFWLKYAEYVKIARQFIKEQQTNNWTLHVLFTKQMLNLFAATAHNNYAKSWRLYVQSIKSLESKNSQI